MVVLSESEIESGVVVSRGSSSGSWRFVILMVEAASWEAGGRIRSVGWMPRVEMEECKMSSRLSI